MGFGDFWGAIADSVATVSDYLAAVVGAIWEALFRVITVLWNVIVYVWNTLVWVAKELWHGLTALRLAKFQGIWGALKRGFERVVKVFTTIRRRLLEPLDRYRRLILEIYRRYWAPVIRFLDSLRVFVRILAIFNRRLAAKLDQKLFALEARLLYPITAALRRLNGMASYLSALVTVSGYLDRALLLESLRRDASLVWEVLTNPRARIFDRGGPAPAGSVKQVGQDARDYLLHGVGPYAEQEPQWKTTFSSVFEDMR